MSTATEMRIGELARLTGVSTDLLRAWERRYRLFSPTRSEGGYRLYTESDLRIARRVNALRAAGVPVAQAIVRVRGGQSSPGAAGARRRIAALEQAVRRFDEPAVVGVLEAGRAELGLRRSLLEVVVPYLQRVGRQWANGELEIGHEHFLSAALRRYLGGLGSGFAARPLRSVVIACPPGEHHEFGAMAMGLLLEELGWSVHFLGGDCPLEEVGRAAFVVGASAIVLSVTRVEVLRRHRGAVTELAAQFPVLLGGAGASRNVLNGSGACPLPADLGAAADLVDARWNSEVVSR